MTSAHGISEAVTQSQWSCVWKENLGSEHRLCLWNGYGGSEL